MGLKVFNRVDADFDNLRLYVENSSYEGLKYEMIQSLAHIRKMDEQTYHQIINLYNHFSYFWGPVDLEQGEYGLFEDRAKQLKEHLDDFVWLYQSLNDYRSRKVLYGILYFWITFDYDYKNSIRENNYSDYFDLDLITCDASEIFVDLGAYNGDSAESFIHNYAGRYQRIYCYEMASDNMEKCKERLQQYDNIIYRNAGVGRKAGTSYMDKSGMDSANVLSDTGKIPVPIVCLDEDITEKITFIKMDIEGSELDAIEGAGNHIIREKPKLAICTYHNNHHIWEIPRRIHELRPDYQFYMRYNGSMNGGVASEYVLIAI